MFHYKYSNNFHFGDFIEALYFQLYAESVWNINLQKKQQTITNIVGKRPNGEYMMGFK